MPNGPLGRAEGKRGKAGESQERVTKSGGPARKLGGLRKSAFNWADGEGVLQPNPVKAVKKPPQRHRDRVLTPDEREEILRMIPDRHFREFVFALQETGARPGEVRKVTAAHVNLELGVWVFKEHKTAKRTGRARVIYPTAGDEWRTDPPD